MPPRYDARVEDALNGDVIIVADCWGCRRKRVVDPRALLSKGWARLDRLRRLETKLRCTTCRQLGLMSLKYPHMLDAEERRALGVPNTDG